MKPVKKKYAYVCAYRIGPLAEKVLYNICTCGSKIYIYKIHELAKKNNTDKKDQNKHNKKKTMRMEGILI